MRTIARVRRSRRSGCASADGVVVACPAGSGRARPGSRRSRIRGRARTPRGRASAGAPPSRSGPLSPSALRLDEHAGRDAPAVGDPQPARRRAPRPARTAPAGAGALSTSISMAPEATSWNSAVSATLRARMPLTDSPCQPRGCGDIETRPRCGFRPNRPHHAAGIRIEPAPSEPSAAPTRPAATAAALPPLDPPGARCRSHGLRVAPKVAVSVNGHSVISGTVGLADDERTRLAQPADDLGVRASRPADGVGSVRCQLAGHVDVVLDRDRHPEQRAGSAPARPARVRLVGFEQYALGEHDAERVQPRRQGARSARRQASTSSREETSPAAISSAWRAIPA